MVACCGSELNIPTEGNKDANERCLGAAIDNQGLPWEELSLVRQRRVLHSAPRRMGPREARSSHGQGHGPNLACEKESNT